MSSPVAFGTVIDERYRVEREIGVGGMGVVVQATHLVLKQRVAIKFLRKEAMTDADAVERFVREAQAAAKVQSDHIVRVHDVATLPDGTPYLVMEYVEGEVLSSMLANRGPLPVREAVRYAMQTCEALAVTHAAGIVHGDLKPENIYIAGVGDAPRRIKLLDFGISKIVVEDGSAGSSVVMGTPAYMAPEQFHTGAVTTSTDIWALGAVLYEMLGGTPPFLGDTPEEIRVRVTSESPAPIARADLPPGLFDIVRQCLQKDPRGRWNTAAELAAMLEEYAPIESAAQRLVGLPLPPPMRTSQKFVPTVVLPNRQKGYGTWAIAGIGMAFVALVLLLVGATRHFARPQAASDAPVTTNISATSTVVSVAPTETATETATTAPAAAAPANTPSSEPSAPPPGATAEASKRAPTAPARRPRRGPKSGAHPGPTDTSRAAAPSPTPDDGDRFGTRK